MNPERLYSVVKLRPRGNFAGAPPDIGGGKRSLIVTICNRKLDTGASSSRQPALNVLVTDLVLQLAVLLRDL